MSPEPEPASIIAVVLGASQWPNYPTLGQGESRSLSNSAEKAEEYLLSKSGLNLPPANVARFFDDDRSPTELLGKIREFLVKRQKATRITDLILYFAGHGVCLDGNKYYLLLRSACENQIQGSALSIDALSETVTEYARHLRKFLIFDACYSGNAAHLWPASRGKGVAVLCSSDYKHRSKAPEKQDLTLFTGALLEVLQSRHEPHGARLSLREVRKLVADRIREKCADAPMPYIHSPDQSEEDLADLPFFPNPAVGPAEREAPEIGERLRVTDDSGGERKRLPGALMCGRLLSAIKQRRVKSAVLAVLVLLALIASPHLFSRLGANNGTKPPLGFYWYGFGERSAEGETKEFVLYDQMTMYNDDDFCIVFTPLENCYAYVISVDANGALTESMKEAAKNNFCRANETYEVPPTRPWFKLDCNTGEETLYVVASYDRLAQLEELVLSQSSDKEKSPKDKLESFISELKSVSRERQQTRSGERIGVRGVIPPERSYKQKKLEFVDGGVHAVKRIRFKHEASPAGEKRKMSLE